MKRTIPFIQSSAFLTLVRTFSCDIIFAQEIRDVKPPVPWPANYIWLIIVGSLAVAAALFFLIRKYLLKARNAHLRKEIKSPWEQAIDQLHELKMQDLPAQGKIKEYYSGLSGIVRQYIEGRYQINAPEMTTEEFLWSLREFDSLTNRQKELLKNFLSSCDMVKFAKYKPQLSEMEESFPLAKKFIEETKPALNPQA